MSTLLLPTALTLGLLGALAILARRARGALKARAGVRAMEVLDRVSLGPKQGVTAIRIAGRVVVVSHGEGGVQRLIDLPEAEWSEVLAARPGDRSRSGALTTEPVRLRLSPVVTAAQRRLVAPRLRRFFLTAIVACATSWPAGAVASATATDGLSVAAPIAAQQAQAPGGSAAQDASRPTGFLQALPPIIERSDDGEARLELSGPVGTAILLGFLALLPTLLLLATGFTRILIVLHLLKQALGAQAVPPTHLINALALLLTLFLMSPTLDRASREAIDPWLDGEITQAQMFERVAVPFHDFMLEHSSEDDVARFVDLRGEEIPDSMEDVPLTTLMAAFTTSELRRAFQLGFVLFLPFIIIDLVVASVLMSMGMFMLPPVMISLPFKLLLFVLADGWGLVVGGLLDSFS